MGDARFISRQQLPQPSRKVRREKTFTGCWSCRSRKVKCDEIVPECSPCRVRGYKCSGYKPIAVWIAPNQHSYQPDLTWHGYSIYNSVTVDDMIAQCDIKSPEEVIHEKSAGPFTVFASKFIDIPHPRSVSSDMDRLFEELNEARLRTHARILFHHYINCTALNMMPFEDPRNPWLSFYPSMARSGYTQGHKSLFYAILAQAAGNLAHLGHNREVMLSLATNFYGRGIMRLRESIEKRTTSFSIILASILTLIMAEVYSGQFNAWKVHLNGAWNFLITERNGQPWQRSEEAWITAQSLCLLKIRSDTMEQPDMLVSSTSGIKQALISSVASREDFGFTIGASQNLLKCISDITSLTSQHYFDLGTHQNAIEELHQRLSICNSQLPSGNEMIQLHHQIFRTGVLIHFHRRILNSTPRILLPHLNALLDYVATYQCLKGGYITLWPVFVGAVEAYQDGHKSRVRTWLDTSQSIGAASRGCIRSLIEAVWRERKQKRDEIGDRVEEGDVVVDWREVMDKMGMDIVLV